MVGERGITLSGGQKQRAAIARAVVRDPRSLSSDDALSSVDTQTEERILNGLRGIMQGRTTILISHRAIKRESYACRAAFLRAGLLMRRFELSSSNCFWVQIRVVAASNEAVRRCAALAMAPSTSRSDLASRTVSGARSESWCGLA